MEVKVGIKSTAIAPLGGRKSGDFDVMKFIDCYEQEQHFFTSYSYIKRMRALGALTGVFGPFTSIL